jgi:uncharacterized protein (DUF1330 family)
MDSFTDGDLQDYLDSDPGGPVVMLNLLRFAPDQGAEKYMEYVASFEESGLNRDYGIEVAFAGRVFPALIAEQDARNWDMIALVRYPSRQAFFKMVHDPRYQQFERLRTDALTASVLQPVSQLSV